MSSSYGASVANRLLSPMVLARLPLCSAHARGGLKDPVEHMLTVVCHVRVFAAVVPDCRPGACRCRT